MSVILSQIPPPSSRTKTRPDYDEIRETLRVTYPRQSPS